MRISLEASNRLPFVGKDEFDQQGKLSRKGKYNEGG